jgi:hypothetical protein
MQTCPVPVPLNSDPGWLGREPTIDEREITVWLSARRKTPARILHVGVGNALLFKEFGNAVTQGLSRDGGEVEHARQLGLNVILCNKYDVNSYRDQLKTPFDCVVDANVRSYSCCAIHFRNYMNAMLASLAAGGMLLTSQRGLAYLIPTTIKELRALCPEWSVSTDGNVVIMRPSLTRRIRSFIRTL